MSSYHPKHMDKELAGAINNTALSFDWVIPKFCINSKEIGESLKSPIFFNSWYLLIYPKGSKEVNKDYIALSVVYCKSVRIAVTLELSAVNSRNQRVVNMKKKDRIFDEVQYGKCYQNFMKRSYFIQGKHGFISGGDLKIQCKIKLRETDWNLMHLSPNSPHLSSHRDEFDDFKKLFDSKELSDVTFVIDGKILLAHKNILLSRSPVFRAMFLSDMKEKNDREIEIKDIEYEVFQEMLRFIYAAKIFNIDSIAQDLLIAAERYEIKGLKTMCEKYLSNKLNDENVLDCLKFADSQNALLLRSQVMDYLKLNADDVIHTPKCKAFSIENPVLMYEIFTKIHKNKRQKVD